MQNYLRTATVYLLIGAPLDTVRALQQVSFLFPGYSSLSLPFHSLLIHQLQNSPLSLFVIVPPLFLHFVIHTFCIFSIRGGHPNLRSVFLSTLRYILTYPLDMEVLWLILNSNGLVDLPVGYFSFFSFFIVEKGFTKLYSGILVGVISQAVSSYLRPIVTSAARSSLKKDQVARAAAAGGDDDNDGGEKDKKEKDKIERVVEKVVDVWIAIVFGLTIYPLQTIQKVQMFKGCNMLSAFYLIYQEGFFAFYGGAGALVAKLVIQSSLMALIR